MRFRKKHLDKMLMWLMTVMMLLPNFLGVLSSVTAATIDSQDVVDSILYDGPDGNAKVSAKHSADGTKVEWEVTLNKDPTEVASSQKLEVDVEDGGLSAPHTISSNVKVETKEGIAQIKKEGFTLEAETTIITFVTDVLDTTRSELTLKMAVATVTEETASPIIIKTSPDTKTLTLTVPVIEEPAAVEEITSEVPVIEEPVSEETNEVPVIEEEVPVEETPVVEEVPPAAEETPPASEEITEEVVKEEPVVKEPVQPEAPNENEEETAPEEKEEAPSPEVLEEKPLTPEIVTPPLVEEEVDPNIAEPISKDYVHHVFAPTINIASKYMNRIRTQATPENPGSIELNKTAEECEGCRTYEVTLDITGIPPTNPLDVVLILDRSGSMSDNTTSYLKVTGNIQTRDTYYVKINGTYTEIEHWSGNTWYYGGFFSRRYITFSPTGNDTSGGNSSSNNPTPKPFYTKITSSRMDALKQAAINFSSLVLEDSQNRVSIVSYAGPTSTSGNGSQSQANQNQGFTNSLSQVEYAINSLSPTGGTNTEAGLKQGHTTMGNARTNAKKVVILFTDGLPTASNGYGYNESNNPNSRHYIQAEGAANTLKAYTELYTIGLTQGLDSNDLSAATTFLERLQNADFIEAPSGEELQVIFENIFQQMDNYGTNAVVKDVIGNNFDLVEGSLPAGATYDAATRTITWNVGALTENPTLTYKVKAKNSVIGSDNPKDKLPTNEWAKIIYTNVNGQNNQEMLFPVPMVYVPRLVKIATSDVTMLKGDSIQLGAGTNPLEENYLDVTGGTGDYTYAWYLGDQKVSDQRNPQVNPTSNTRYKVVVTDQKGCETVGYIDVKVKTGSLTVHKVNKDNTLIKNSPATFTLSKEGANTVLTTGNTGIVTFTDLSKGVYTLTETTAPNGYVKDTTVYTVTVSWEKSAVKVAVTKPGSDGSNAVVIPSVPLKIMNETNTKEILVTKRWDDNDNVLNYRPEKVTVHLYQDEATTPFRTLELTNTNGWKGSFTGLPRYDANGVEYNYSIDEVDVPRYASAISGFTITNRLLTTELQILKVNENNVPITGEGMEATFRLSDQDGTFIKLIDTDPTTGIATITDLKEGTYLLNEFEAPLGYITDRTFTYRITVTRVADGLQVAVTSGNDENHPHEPLTITNHKQMIEVPVLKFWEDNDDALGLRPDSITIHLYQNYQEGDDPIDTITITPDEFGNWEGKFKALPQYNDNGNEHIYTIREADVAHYDSEVDATIIRNTIKVGKLTITKVDKNDPQNPILLNGAEFELRDAEQKVIASGVTVNGILDFENIPFGTYTLVETKAPAGYQLPNSHKEITIGGDAGQHVTVEILNQKKSPLPETGGFGTTIFTALGLSLMGISALYFKKTKKNNDREKGEKNNDL